MRVIRFMAPDPPALPPDVQVRAMAMAREQSLNVTPERQAVLLSCAAECEAYCGRLLVPGARAITTELETEAHDRDALPVVPEWPDTSGVELTTLTVRMWREGAWVESSYVLRPGLRVELPEAPGEYELAAVVEVAAPMLTAAVEAIVRLFGYRETRRSGDVGDVLAAGPLNLSSAMRRSGAADILRAGIRKVRTG